MCVLCACIQGPHTHTRLSAPFLVNGHKCRMAFYMRDKNKFVSFLLASHLGLLLYYSVVFHLRIHTCSTAPASLSREHIVTNTALSQRNSVRAQ